MQFTKAFALLALPLLAAASPLVQRTEPTNPGPNVNCSSGNVQCCNTVTNTSNPQGVNTLIPGLLTAILSLGANVPIGLQCTPIPILGIGSSGCKSQPVCCTGNTFNGLVNVGCTPISIL